MKNLFYTLSAITMLLATSCQPEYEPIGEEFSKIEGINGKWKLSKVLQVDESSPLKEARDLSAFYTNPDGQNQYLFDFNAASRSLAIENGKGKNFFGTNTLDSSKWQLVHSIYPEYAEKYPDFVQIINNQGDTLNLKLIKPIRKFDQEMGLQLVRCKLSYQFFFTRQN